MAKTAKTGIDLPRGYVARMTELLGDEIGALLKVYQEPPKAGLRLNPLKVTPSEFKEMNLFNLEHSPWCEEAFLIAGGDAPGKHPYHAAGLYYIQEPSAAIVTEMVNPQPGERILDLAAAPGGKSTQLAGKMRGQGVLVANEIHPQRAWDLAQNLERWGARNVIITNETPERLAERWEGWFDKVLLDAPCSGEGMFRKSASARQDWSPELVAGCAFRQREILAKAAEMVRPGGHLVYSTCTFAPEENEGVIGDFLTQRSDFVIEDGGFYANTVPGKPEWVKGAPAELSKAVRIFPHLAPGEGHFVVRLRRTGSSSPDQDKPGKLPANGRRLGIADPLLKPFWDFWKETFSAPFPVGGLALVGSYLYRLPDHLPDLPGLRVLHPGWWLGTLKPNHFIPSHGLALGMGAADARLTVSFSLDQNELTSYFRGETIPSPGQNRWVLVCVDAYPVGWGKRVNGVLKNHYPKGLRKYG